MVDPKLRQCFIERLEIDVTVKFHGIIGVVTYFHFMPILENVLNFCGEMIKRESHIME